MGGRETSAPFEEASAGGFSRCPAAGHPPGIESSCRARRSGPVWGFIKRPHCAYEDKDSESAEILRKVLEENIGCGFSEMRGFLKGWGVDNAGGGGWETPATAGQETGGTRAGRGPRVWRPAVRRGFGNRRYKGEVAFQGVSGGRHRRGLRRPGQGGRWCSGPGGWRGREWLRRNRRERSLFP